MNAGTGGLLGVMNSGPAGHGAAANSVATTTGQLHSDDGSKKIRKPYTITKSRESWTEQEHDKFLEALQLFDRDWKKIEAFVGSKTVIQIRSHAQKYFLKVQKNGTGEHVPPPRPKRKSAQPYPQKASKGVQQGYMVGNNAVEYGYMIGPNQCNVFVPSVSAVPVSAWVHHAVPSGGSIINKVADANQQEATTITNGRNLSSSSSGSSPGSCPQQGAAARQGVHECGPRATPDFAEVYKFIGGVFDPGVNGHLKKLNEMVPIDRETVLLLMRNLTINLSSPDFQEDKLILSYYGGEQKPTLAHSKGDALSMPVTDTLVSVQDAEEDDASVPVQTGPKDVPASHTNPTVDAEEIGQHHSSQSAAEPSKQQCHPYDGGGCNQVSNMSNLYEVSDDALEEAKIPMDVEKSLLDFQPTNKEDASDSSNLEAFSPVIVKEETDGGWWQ